MATECELDNGHRPAAGDSRHTSSGGANMPSATSNATITDTLDLTETEALPKETNQSILLLFFFQLFCIAKFSLLKSRLDVLSKDRIKYLSDPLSVTPAPGSHLIFFKLLLIEFGLVKAASEHNLPSSDSRQDKPFPKDGYEPGKDVLIDQDVNAQPHEKSRSEPKKEYQV